MCVYIQFSVKPGLHVCSAHTGTVHKVMIQGSCSGVSVNSYDFVSCDVMNLVCWRAACRLVEFAESLSGVAEGDDKVKFVFSAAIRFVKSFFVHYSFSISQHVVDCTSAVLKCSVGNLT